MIVYVVCDEDGRPVDITTHFEDVPERIVRHLKPVEVKPDELLHASVLEFDHELRTLVHTFELPEPISDEPPRQFEVREFRLF